MLHRFKRASWWVRLSLIGAIDRWRSRGVPGQYTLEIPYYSQFESPRLAEQVISNKNRLQYDPHWRRSGASSPQEYASWAWHTCGMACLKMALAASTGHVRPVVTLAKECEQFGGYVRDEHGSIDAKGLRYKPFCRYVIQQHGWQAQVAAPFSVDGIMAALANERFVIASIPPSSVFRRTQVSRRGGHLVLITGYDRNAQTITYHDPAGGTTHGPSVTVGLREFASMFANRGIILGPHPQTDRQ